MRSFLLFILLIPSSIFAQAKFGVVVGGSASFSNSHFGTYRYGIPFGISLTERLHDRIYLSQNALFRFDGYRFNQDVPAEFLNGEIIRDLGDRPYVHQVNSLEFPLLINFTAKNGKLKPYFGIGSSIKFAIYSKEQISVEYRHFELSELPLTNNVDFNLIGLIGTKFKVLNHFINLEVRYNYGLVKIIDNRKLSSVSLLIFIRK